MPDDDEVLLDLLVPSGKRAELEEDCADRQSTSKHPGCLPVEFDGPLDEVCIRQTADLTH